MSYVVLIGASGFVGSGILKELLDRGHKVTAVSRHPEKITTEHTNLIITKTDISSQDNVVKISKGADAVISSYNPGWGNPNIYNETLSVYTTILNGVKKAGVKRLLCVGGAGTLFISPGVRLANAGILPDEIMPAVKSLGEFYLEILTKEKDIDWVFFSPAGNIAPGERTGKYRLGKDDLIVDEKGESKISVEDYAVAMVNELEKEEHHQERFTIGY